MGVVDFASVPSVTKTYNLYADGSEFTNLKLGGYGYVLDCPDGTEIIGKGYDYDRRINTMELYAVINGLYNLNTPSSIIVYTDSKYVIDGVNSRIKINQKVSAAWFEMKLLAQVHDITWVKVVNDPQHLRAHHYAREAVLCKVKSRHVNSKIREESPRIHSESF